MRRTNLVSKVAVKSLSRPTSKNSEFGAYQGRIDDLSRNGFLNGIANCMQTDLCNARKIQLKFSYSLIEPIVQTILVALILSVSEHISGPTARPGEVHREFMLASMIRIRTHARWQRNENTHALHREVRRASTPAVRIHSRPWSLCPVWIWPSPQTRSVRRAALPAFEAFRGKASHLPLRMPGTSSRDNSQPSPFKVSTARAKSC